MKKRSMIILLAFLGMFQMLAQEYEYIPFVREGIQWKCLKGAIPSRYSSFTLELKDNVEINGKIYTAMHKYGGDAINTENDTVLVYLREQDKVVYGIVPDGKTYADFTIGVPADAVAMQQIAAGEEFVLYDFNEPVKFLEPWSANPYQERTVFPDVINLAGRNAMRYISKYNGAFCAIESIGYDGLWSWYPLGYCQSCNLDCVIENGEVIYSSEFHKRVREKELTPLVREGVQWVNEKVIINKGDTTRYYYNYEFRGENYYGYPICYYYTGDVLNTEQATVAAVFQVSNAYHITIHNDNAFYQTIEEGRDMISYLSNQPVISFAEGESDIEWDDPVNFYLFSQKGDFLSRQNFFEVEPVEIDGHECRRYAFVGEDGEPQAYVVEGIGFDSRDMGDLLTPFTRKPDPDADYQEYCGLSHVIKDGKIIYKGMRYREEAPASVDGDVNGDGQVTIADVTVLIDLLLNGGSPRFSAACDLNRDQNVSIADVTALIDLLLNGE